MKGVLFSSILVFLAIFLVMFISYQYSLTSFYSSQRSVESRINSILNYYYNIISDSERSLQIISKVAVSTSVNYIVTNGIPLSSSNDTIVELMTNGTINGEGQGLIENSTIKDWEDNMEQISSLQGFNTNISISDIEVHPSDSFHLSVSYSISVDISDPVSDTNISKNSTESFVFSVENFEDPLYPLNTNGMVSNIVKESPHWHDYPVDDQTNLNDDLSNSYYHPSLSGASFLDRLEGKYYLQDKYSGTNPVGLESFVDKDKLLSVGLLINSSASSTDYLYFSGSGVQSYSISGMPSNFRLDGQATVEGQTHIQIYNATAI